MVWGGVSVLKKSIIASLTFITLYGNTLLDIKAQIISSIAHLVANKKNIKIYVDDPAFEDIFKADKNIRRVYKCYNADVILTKNSKNIRQICKKKEVNIISTKYKDYKQNNNVDIGAFFWQKGRPNLLINSKIIQQRNISVPKSFLKYMD